MPMSRMTLDQLKEIAQEQGGPQPKWQGAQTIISSGVFGAFVAYVRNVLGYQKSFEWIEKKTTAAMLLAQL